VDEVLVRKGKILVYRFYEVGSEVDLVKAAALLQQKQNVTRFSLDRPGKSAMVIATEPLTVHLGGIEVNLGGNKVGADLDIRVWHYGNVSLCFHIPLPEGTAWSELVRLASWLERDKELDVIARTKVRVFQSEIATAIPVLNDWPTYEDYVVYYLQEVQGIPDGAQQLFEKADVPALMLAEPKERLSDQVKRTVREGFLQYSRDDMALIDWNSALIVEPSGSMDVPMVIEFANSQLLEMRYYDDLLDEKLDALYKSVAGQRPGILSNAYSRLGEEAGQIYLEIAEVVENVENSLKVVGDFYLATVFRTASARFRFSDWQKSINEKLGNLAEVSKLLHSQVSESRSHWLEVIIIVLIGIELVPFFKDLILK
jgi:hypothetical protein